VCSFKNKSATYEIVNLILGLAEMGLELFVPTPSARCATLTTIKVPKGLDWKAVTVYAMDK
jgi:aspartate aminotransferase-like enzyme